MYWFFSTNFFCKSKQTKTILIPIFVSLYRSVQNLSLGQQTEAFMIGFRLLLFFLVFLFPFVSPVRKVLSNHPHPSWSLLGGAVLPCCPCGTHFSVHHFPQNKRIRKGSCKEKSWPQGQLHSLQCSSPSGQHGAARTDPRMAELVTRSQCPLCSGRWLWNRLSSP